VFVAVLYPSLLVMSGPAAAATSNMVIVHHARECASVRQAQAGTIVVPVVVDTGGPSDVGRVSCVTVPTGSNGAQVLTARAKLLGEPAPRYAVSGLLCAIDGYPATGCGLATGGHYAYWAYYHGGSSWSYASVGPASWPVTAGDVEGWRFEPDGSATPSDPPPRSPSDAATLCPASGPPTTTTTTTPTGPPPSTTVPGPGTTAPATSGGHGGSGTPKPPTTPGGPKPFGATAGAGPGNPTPDPATASTVLSSATTTPGTTSGTDPPIASTARRLAVKPRGPGPGGFPYAPVLAGGLIALLAVGAVIRSRRSARAD
jgi:hypothetical protein